MSIEKDKQAYGRSESGLARSVKAKIKDNFTELGDLTPQILVQDRGVNRLVPGIIFDIEKSDDGRHLATVVEEDGIKKRLGFFSHDRNGINLLFFSSEVREINLLDYIKLEHLVLNRIRGIIYDGRST